MAAKVTFDTDARLVIVSADPVNQKLELDVQVDLYSDGKEDWLASEALSRLRFPVDAIGGNPVPAGKIGSTFILRDPWQIDPDKNQDVTVGSTQVSTAAVQGDGGTNEAVRQGFTMPSVGFVQDGQVTVRKVGSPTDALRVEVIDSVDVVLEQFDIEASALEATFQSEFFGSELEGLSGDGEALHFVFTRTGARDTNNFYELALDGDVFAGGTAESKNSGVWSDTGGDVVMSYRTVILYELTITGNLFTETGVSPVVQRRGVSTLQNVSTLVEFRDVSQNPDLTLLRKLTQNRKVTDPATGKLIIYDDDDATVLKEALIFEDVDGDQAYQGSGLERQDRLDDPA